MKKIIAVVLTVAFIAVTPALPAGAAGKTVKTTSPGGGQWCCLVIAA